MALNEMLQSFHFLRPLWLLALPLLWALAVWLARRRGREGNWAQLIDPVLLPGLRLDSGTIGAPVAPWLALAWTLAALALAGPCWERDAAPAYRAGAAWVLVLDLSSSMMAADVAPNRLTRARYALDDLLGAAQDARVGLVVFSAEPYTVTPLTEDVATVRALLQPLAPEIMPSAGDRLAPALEKAGQLLNQAQSRDQHIIVLTDGFEDPAAAFAAAQKLKSKGICLSVIGIGTRNGAPQPQAEGGFAKDAQGQARLARLDADLVQHLASVGGGTYADLGGVQNLIGGLQAQHQISGASAAAKDVQVARWRDAGVWFLPLLMMTAALLSRRGWL